MTLYQLGSQPLDVYFFLNMETVQSVIIFSGAFSLVWWSEHAGAGTVDGGQPTTWGVGGSRNDSKGC